MKLEGTGLFSYTLEITKNDCMVHNIDFDLIVEYETYKQNKHLYDKVPDYYFEPATPPTPPKKTCFLKNLFKKKECPAETEPQVTKVKTKMDIYFDKKFEELKATGLPLYTKDDLNRLFQNENKLVALVRNYAKEESQKEQPSFEDRGFFSYHYELTENDTIVFYVRTATLIL